MNEGMVKEFRKNKKELEERIEEAARQSGRKPEDIRIMAVTKTFPESMIEIARENGIGLFGENRVKEAAEKYARWSDRLELHLVGHLQRNKARMAAEVFDWVDSIDKIETALVLNKEAAGRGKEIHVLLEVNSSGEETKFGVSDEESMWRLFDGCIELDSLSLRGIMTIGPFTDDAGLIRAAFSGTRRLYTKARERYPDLPLDTLSMGMSGDFELAVKEGSTMVRIGSALFGQRTVR
jgi:pyridoxal phosphate enzyme (YggS family)